MSFSIVKRNEILKELSKLASALGKHTEAEVYQRRFLPEPLSPRPDKIYDDPTNNPDLYQTARLPTAHVSSESHYALEI